MKTRLILPFLFPLMGALPAMAAPSFCSHLPERGSVAAAAPMESVPARPRADRGLICPPGFALEVASRLPVCTRPGRATIEGDPRKACRASLALGPVAPVPAQWRPTRTCPGGAISAIIRADGANLGMAEVEVATDSPGVKVTPLEDDSAGLAPRDRPTAQGCFAHQCRLLRISIAADAPDEALVRFSIKDGAGTTLKLPVITHCPDPLARQGAAPKAD